MVSDLCIAKTSPIRIHTPYIHLYLLSADAGFILRICTFSLSHVQPCTSALIHCITQHWDYRAPHSSIHERALVQAIRFTTATCCPSTETTCMHEHLVVDVMVAGKLCTPVAVTTHRLSFQHGCCPASKKGLWLATPTSPHHSRVLSLPSMHSYHDMGPSSSISPYFSLAIQKIFPTSR